MKTILFLFIAIISTTAFAVDAPKALVGRFEYADHFLIDAVRRVEVVEESKPDTQERVRKLVENGHVCSPILKGFACTKSLANESARDWAGEKVRVHFEGWLITLNQAIGDMKLVFRTDFQKMWTVEQKTYLPGRATYHADYVWTQGEWSVYPWSEGELRDLRILIQPEGLQVPLTFEREDGLGIEQAMVKANLKSVQ